MPSLHSSRALRLGVGRVRCTRRLCRRTCTSLGEVRSTRGACAPYGKSDAFASERPGVYDSAGAAIACYRRLEEAGLPRIAGRASRSTRAPTMPGPNPAHHDGDDPPTPLDEDAMAVAAVPFRGEVMPDMVQRQLRAEGMVDALNRLETPPQEAWKSRPRSRPSSTNHCWVQGSKPDGCRLR